ncbi:MAG TPA: hypothetical protein VFV34_22190 [Blastocatellia bacterium]|nr:hypothetical protein [Blastocatellia bacterium]
MCLTLLGLIKVVEGVKNVRSIADELLAVNAVGFLLSGMISYFALKEGRAPHKNKKARVGDFIFSASLCMLALICGVVLIELT